MSTPAWTTFASQMPPPHSGFLLVTNNAEARDAFGHHSHIWLVSIVHLHAKAVKEGSYTYAEEGEITAFDEPVGQRIRNLTHWRFAIPEDAAACESNTEGGYTILEALRRRGGAIAEMAEDLDWGRFLEDLDPETVVNGVDARSGGVMREPPEPVTVPTERRFGARLLDAAIGDPEEQARVRRIAAAIDKDAELERGRIRLELKLAVRTLYQVHDAVIESDIEAVIDRIVPEVRP